MAKTILEVHIGEKDKAYPPPSLEFPVIPTTYYLPTPMSGDNIRDNSLGTIPRVKSIRTGRWTMILRDYRYQLVDPLPETADPDFKYPVIIRMWGEDFLMERLALVNLGTDGFQDALVQFYTGLLGLHGHEDIVDDWYTHLPSTNPLSDPLWWQDNPEDAYPYVAGDTKPVDLRTYVPKRGTVSDKSDRFGKIVRGRAKASDPSDQAIFDALDDALEEAFRVDEKHWSPEPPRIQRKFRLTDQRWRELYQEWHLARKDAARQALAGRLDMDEHATPVKMAEGSYGFKLFHPLMVFDYNTKEVSTIPEGEQIGIADWEPPIGQVGQKLTRPVKVYWHGDLWWAEKADLLNNNPEGTEVQDQMEDTNKVIDKIMAGDLTVEAALNEFGLSRVGQGVMSGVRKASSLVQRHPIASSAGAAVLGGAIFGGKRRRAEKAKAKATSESLGSNLPTNSFSVQDSFALLKDNSSAKSAVDTLVSACKAKGWSQPMMDDFFRSIPFILVRFEQDSKASTLSDSEILCPKCGSDEVHVSENELTCATCSQTLNITENTNLLCQECGIETSGTSAYRTHLEICQGRFDEKSKEA